MSEKLEHALRVVRGVDGIAVYLNDHRIAGLKPWGGVTELLLARRVSTSDLRKAMKYAVVLNELRAAQQEKVDE